MFLQALTCPAPQVRGAFFELMCALCEFTSGLVQAEAARVCPAVLLSIDDTDPVVLPPVWEAVLYVVTTIPVSMTSLCPNADVTWASTMCSTCVLYYSRLKEI